MLEQLVNFLLEEARPEILKVARPDSCIFSTRVAVGVCRQLGVGARAVAVQTCIFNPPLTERIRAHLERFGAMPPAELIKAWQYDDSGGWGVALGYGDPRPGKYAGHVVALVDERVILDLSIDQANRPERGIELRPLAVLDVPAGWGLGSEALAFTTCNGCALRIAPHDDASFLRCRDWNMRNRSRPTIENLVARFKARLGVPS